ncbi:MAG: SCO family protein [Candidatus Thiodiazotropha sp.]|nr:SCO family protein [Candidatus Thiodiazotropha sp. (ex Lucina pensylvanica)]PUB79792.1 MAG: SCO family protein [gamma proteobacterium symbiont of Ctena orbiculata]
MIRWIPLFFALLLLPALAASDDAARHERAPEPGDEQPGGDFTLQSSRGEFALKQFRGRVVLLYFGYTKCPDVCPTSLAVLAQALGELSDDDLKMVQGVFVSVDPDRDSFQVLDDYVSYFHPNLIGVTGTAAELAEVAALYGVEYGKVDLADSAFGYAVDHTSTTYLITPEGDLRFMFPHQTPSFVILEAIRYVLTADPSG